MLLSPDLGGRAGLAFVREPRTNKSESRIASPTIRLAARPYELRYPTWGEQEAVPELANLAPPLPELVAWGEQRGEGMWFNLTEPKLFYARRVTDAILQQVKNDTMGYVPLSVLFLTRKPLLLSTLEQAFERSSYRLGHALALSEPLDNRKNPRLLFGAVGLLRNQEDLEAGPKSVGDVARALGAVPAVVIFSRPTTWRAWRPIASVMTEQFQAGLL